MKIVYLNLAFFAAAYFGIMIFNHGYPWIGIGVIFAAVVTFVKIGYNLLLKYLKNND